MPLPTARGAEKAAQTAQAPSPPLRSAPHPPPRRPSETERAAAAGWPGSSRAEDESRAMQTWAHSQSQRAALQGKPPAGPTGHPHVTQCHLLRNDPEPGLTSPHTSPTGVGSPTSPFLLPTLEARAGWAAIPGRRPAAPAGTRGS